MKEWIRRIGLSALLVAGIVLGLFVIDCAAQERDGHDMVPPAGLVPVAPIHTRLILPRPTHTMTRRYWTVTPPGAHHKAVIVCGQGNGAGTGALVWKSEDESRGVILTAQHVISGTGWAQWDGWRSQAKVLATDPQSDIALCMVKPPKGAAVIPLTRDFPSAGDYVEVCGYGGPADSGLRHFWATFRGHSHFNSYVVSGDSGGPIIFKGGVIGAVSGGSRVDQVRDAWPLHSPTRAQPRGAVVSLAERVSRTYFSGQWNPYCPGCPPSTPQPRTNPYIPPPPTDPDKPTEPPATCEPCKCKPCRDGEQGPQGEPGAPGAPGPAGPQGPPGVVDLDELIRSLPPIVFNTVDDDGNVLQSVTVPLGGQLNINHRPIR